jgi:hypothetical protein
LQHQNKVTEGSRENGFLSFLSAPIYRNNFGLDTQNVVHTKIISKKLKELSKKLLKL